MEFYVKRKDDSKDELKHSGVDGMHWYKRRYQDKQGRLTELGKKHYAEMRANKKNKDQPFG